MTGIYQGYPDFHSPFQGPKSLSPDTQIRETISGTAFLGRRLPWQGGALYFNPEFNQGFGFNRTNGLAGFSNGEAQKAGFNTPKPDVARLFLRQTWGLGGEQETLEPGPNQLAETVMNWSLMDGGTYDYAADQKGYSDGTAIELNQKSWALRGGYFLVPKVSNDRNLETRIGQFGGYNLELETRYALFSQPGKFRVLGFANRVFAGSFRETLANPAFGTDIARTRHDRTKHRFVLNLEQALSHELGVFSRVSWNDGKERSCPSPISPRAFPWT